MSSKVKVITCIRDAWIEDRLVPAILETFHDGEFIFRSSNPELVIKFLHSRFEISEFEELGRTFIFHDCGDTLPPALSALAKKNDSLLIIDINRFSGNTIEDLCNEISATVRTSALIIEEKPLLLPIKNQIMITGDGGASGVTTVAANLAWELSQRARTLGIDLNLEKQDLAEQFGGRKAEAFFSPFKNLTISSTLGEIQNADVIIVDVGHALNLEMVRTDRRNSARKFHDLLASSEIIIYVINGEQGNLNSFLDFYGSVKEFSRAHLLVLLNKFQSTPQSRQIYKELKSLLNSKDLHLGHRDISTFDRIRTERAMLGQIAPRTRIRKDLALLADGIAEILARSLPEEQLISRTRRAATRRG